MSRDNTHGEFLRKISLGKHERRVLKEGIARGIQVSKEKVDDVGKRKDTMDRYVLRGLPDVEGVS